MICPLCGVVMKNEEEDSQDSLCESCEKLNPNPDPEQVIFNPAHGFAEWGNVGVKSLQGQFFKGEK